MNYHRWSRRLTLIPILLGFLLVALVAWGVMELRFQFRDVNAHLSKQAEETRALAEAVQSINLQAEVNLVQPPGGPGLPLDPVTEGIVKVLWDQFAKAIGQELPPVARAPAILGRLGGKFAESFVGELGSQAAKALLRLGRTPQSPAANSDSLSISIDFVSQANTDIPIWAVYFDLDKAIVPVSGRPAILGAARWGQAFSRTLVLFGSTDTTGPERHNRVLAQRRIAAVRQILTQEGFGAVPVIGIPLDDAHRPITTSSQVSEPKNRCVYILAL